MKLDGFLQGHLFANLPEDTASEVFDCLALNANARIERIVSHGQASPPGFWYDQHEDEFVLLVSGEAKLRVEGRDDVVHLKPGDWINLPAHRLHRVEWTSTTEPTIWLAVFSKHDPTVK